MREAGDPHGLRALAITTNGLLLQRRLPGLIQAGLTGVNISLDTLDAAKFQRMTRRAGCERVQGAIRAAVDSNLPDPVKVNCVVMGGVNDVDMQPMAELARTYTLCMLLSVLLLHFCSVFPGDLPLHMRFIEYMPFDDNQWSERQGNTGSMVPYTAMLASVRADFPELVPANDAGEVLVGHSDRAGSTAHPSAHSIAKLYSAPDWAGAVGFITSMTSAFCGGCSRLRLTADGALKVCLFGNTEVSLRDAMRAGVDDAGLQSIICGALQGKAWAYGGHASPAAIAASSNRPMILIGG
jgi:cyclic pyranopterin phosphate synthase